MAAEVTMEEFARRLSPQQTLELESARVQGHGLAMYSDGHGKRVAVTYGKRDSQITYQHAPKVLPNGGGELEQFVPAQQTPAQMQSPLKAALEDQTRIPQIHRPRVAPTQTQYPEVLLSGRTSSHPRRQQRVHHPWASRTRTARRTGAALEHSRPVVARSHVGGH